MHPSITLSPKATRKKNGRHTDLIVATQVPTIDDLIVATQVPTIVATQVPTIDGASTLKSIRNDRETGGNVMSVVPSTLREGN
ncbi:unnamed protein product, partial [Brassica oleracea]